MLLSHLPRELRDHIYTFVCLAIRDQPHPSTCRKEDRKIWAQQDQSVASAARDRVWFERQPVQTPLLSLLLVNRQVYREAREVLCRIGNSPNCVLDVMFLKDEALWPTWLSVPKLGRNLGTVHTQFRVFHAPDHLRADDTDDLYGSDGPGPPPIVWLFYHLLAAFFQNGPLAVGKEAGGGSLTVKTLILDFLPAGEQEILPLPSFIQYFKEVDDISTSIDFDYNSMRNTVNNGLLVAEYLAHFVRALLLRVLNLGPLTMKYGKILYENVGDIEIWIDGRFKWSLDIPRLFSNIVFDHGLSTSHRLKNEQRFEQWKEATSRRRASADLPIESC